MDFAAGFTFKVKRFKSLEDIKDGKTNGQYYYKDQKKSIEGVPTQQLTRLWNADFKDLNASDKVLNSVLNFVEESVKLVDSHFQVALP